MNEKGGREAALLLHTAMASGVAANASARPRRQNRGNCSRARVPQLPDVQTLSETFPGFEQYSWFGILGPAGLPKDVAAKVHRETVRTLQAPDVNGKLTEQGFEIVASSPEEFVKFVQGESDKLGRLIRDNKIVAE